MDIKPLYRSDSEVLVGLPEDFREVCVLDGLVMSVDLKNKKIVHEPWSGQRILRNGDYTPIMKHQKDEYRQKIRKALKKRKITEVENKLKDPPKEAVDSLIWKPERLLNARSQDKR